MNEKLRKRLTLLRQAYELARGATGSRWQGLRNILFVLWADRVRRSRPFHSDPDALTEKDLCPHASVRTIRWLPRLIVRCRRCGVAFAMRRDDVKVATERHDDAYFLANKDFIYRDGKPDVFTYVMPRTLFFWALGLYGFRPANRRALDVGCGVGIMVRYLGFLGFEAEGVEISGWAVDYARRELGLPLVRKGTLQEAGYPDGRFGFVTLVHVLEHLDDPLPMLREIRRVLEPGGLLYVELPSSERDVTDYGIDDHFWFHSVDSLRHLLGCSGFRDVRIGEGTFRPELHKVPFIFATARKPSATAS